MYDFFTRVAEPFAVKSHIGSNMVSCLNEQLPLSKLDFTFGGEGLGPVSVYQVLCKDASLCPSSPCLEGGGA